MRISGSLIARGRYKRVQAGPRVDTDHRLDRLQAHIAIGIVQIGRQIREG